MNNENSCQRSQQLEMRGDGADDVHRRRPDGEHRHGACRDLCVARVAHDVRHHACGAARLFEREHLILRADLDADLGLPDAFPRFHGVWVLLARVLLRRQRDIVVSSAREHDAGTAITACVAQRNGTTLHALT